MSENIGKTGETVKATAGKDTGGLPEWPVWEKTQWPELVGKDGETAKATIQNENPKLEVFILKTGQGQAWPIGAYSPYRVRIAVDENGIVIATPTIG